MKFSSTRNNGTKDKQKYQRSFSFGDIVKEWILIPFLVVIFILGLSISNKQSQSKIVPLEEQNRQPQINIAHISQLHKHSNDYKEIFKKLDLISWDLAVFNGNTINLEKNDNLEEIEQESLKTFNQSIFLPGEKDNNATFFQKKDYPSSVMTGSVQNIFIDFEEINNNNSDNCSFPEHSISQLKEHLKEEASHRILYISTSWWLEAESSLSDEKIKESRKCLAQKWEEEIHPIINKKVGIVIGADGVRTSQKKIDDVRYVRQGIHSGKGETNSKVIFFSRISLIDNELILQKYSLSNSTMIDQEVLSKIPSYEIQVEQQALEDLYNSLPIYNIVEKNFLELLDDPNLIHRKIQGEAKINQQTYNIELETRGNIGNNWSGLKKSWTLNFTDPDGYFGRKQLKFILPSDRGFAAQPFITQINNYLEVPTPQVHIGQLIINDYNFGPYLIYEDFDKPFIELQQYNSDGDTFGNTFADDFGFYDVWEDINFTSKNKPKRDKTYQQKILKEYHERLENYFEREQYQRWIAVQIYIGDQHQNASDNMRFFLDKSTGRVIIVAWDQTFTSLAKKENPLALQKFQSKIMKNPEDREAILRFVDDLIENERDFDQSFKEFRTDYESVFKNDPYADFSEQRIERSFDNLYNSFKTNNQILKNHASQK